MLQRILVGLDGSPLAESILPYVTALARGLGASVTLLHVVQLPDEVRMGGEELQSTFQERVNRSVQAAQDYLGSVGRRVAEASVPVSAAVVTGAPAGELLAFAQHEGMDLIALATHGRSGLQRWRFGSVADTVLHGTLTALLLLRPYDGLPAAAPSHDLRSLLVPLDGSPLSEAALPFAERLATGLRLPVTLLRTVEPLSLFGLPGAVSPETDEGLSSIREELRRYLERQAQGLRDRGLAVETRAVFGRPAQTIIEEAGARPGSLVVMATTGRSGLLGQLLGSVARQVAYHLGAPILLVRANAVPMSS